ncbi:hypothetical protein D3C81_1937190 [compost metagenome]
MLAKKFCGPKTKNLVAASFRLEAQFSIECEFAFESVAAIIHASGHSYNSQDSRARFDLIKSDRALNVYFNAHLFRKPFRTFRDAL